MQLLGRQREQRVISGSDSCFGSFAFKSRRKHSLNLFFKGSRARLFDNSQPAANWFTCYVIGLYYNHVKFDLGFLPSTIEVEC